MDADIQAIMVAGTVQTDSQVCDSVTVSFLTQGLPQLWQNRLWSLLSLCALERRERGGASLGQALPWMGVNFRIAGGAKGSSALSCRTAKVNHVLPFSHSRQKFWHCPVTI